ncbi:MAG: 50S ribosomal protein L4 [archaeon]|nr:50S ribosomal protein L4 [archaeon]
MKAQLYDLTGKAKGEIELPKIFSTPLREDVIAKLVEVERFESKQPFSLAPTAGRRHSASGTISHRRHEWKGHYGKGISRVPRKTMWRRGTQFYWIAAEVSGTRGGRRVHCPTLSHAPKKINKKEALFALNSAIASTSNSLAIKKRYSSLANKELKIKFPIVIESKLENVKSKDFISALKMLLGDLFPLALKHKEVRAGKGKQRGRKYKSNAGILLITSNSEKIKLSGIDVIPLNELSVSDLYPAGRITMFTEKAMHELGGKK